MDEETEISDLQTAKIALHGALAMMRNLQDLNQRLKGEIQDAAHREKLIQKREVEAQAAAVRLESELAQLKLYYTAFESNLKDKARQEAMREEQAKWEPQLQKLQETLDTLQKSRTLKEEEFARVREDIAKKDKTISLLLEQNTNAKMRLHAEWIVSVERLEAQHLEHLKKATEIKEKTAQDQWADRVAKLQERCKMLEQELTDKDHLLTNDFHERMQRVLGQEKLREQSLWNYTQRMREGFEAEIKKRFDQRLEMKETEHHAALVAQEQSLRVFFEKEQAAYIEAYKQKMSVLEVQWLTREKALIQEKEDAYKALREKAREPQLILKEETEAFKARLEEEFIEKERLLREHYLKFEKAAEERAHQKELDYLALLAEEKEKLNKIHTELLHNQLAHLTQNHQETLAEQERAQFHWRHLADQHQARIHVLEQQLAKITADHDIASQQAMAFELELERTKNAAQMASASFHDKSEEKYRALKAELQQALQKQGGINRELEHELTLAHQREEQLSQALASQDTKTVERYAQLEKELREKERRLDSDYRKLKEDTLDKQAELSQHSLALEQHREELKQSESSLEQRQLQLDVLEKQCQFLRDQLSGALRHTDRIDPELSDKNQHMVDEWIFGFAHQIRNPLAIIRTTAEALSESKASAKHSKALDAIIQSADGLTHRLLQFMEFSKPINPTFKPVMLDQILRDTLTTMRDHVLRASVKVNYSADEKLPVVPGDAHRFQEALSELLLNGLEAMPQGGTFDIRATYDPSHDQVRILFHDSGGGISTHHMTQIGKPFFTTKAGHAGLGLATVKRVMHLYAGDMKIESRPGEGTTVHCYFSRKGWAP